jgi:hypothetical protein
VNASKSATVTWNFGDGEVVEGGNVMSHIYKNSGDFSVKVSIAYATCKEDLGQTLTLVSNKFSKANAPVVTRNNDQFVLNFNFDNPTDVSIRLTDALGKEVISGINKTVGNDKVVLSTSTLSDGIYFVNIVYNGQTQSSKMIK